MITFQVESWKQYYSDPNRELLWKEHYTELAQSHGHGRMPMAPNIPAYLALEAAGQLLIVVAREAGQMVGYTVSVIRPHMHYPTLCGFEDALFLTSPSRRGMAGYRLVVATLQELKRRGVKKTFWHSKLFLPIAKLFQRLGMEKSDEIYSAWIGD